MLVALITPATSCHSTALVVEISASLYSNPERSAGSPNTYSEKRGDTPVSRVSISALVMRSSRPCRSLVALIDSTRSSASQVGSLTTPVKRSTVLVSTPPSRRCQEIVTVLPTQASGSTLPVVGRKLKLATTDAISSASISSAPMSFALMSVPSSTTFGRHCTKSAAASVLRSP